MMSYFFVLRDGRVIDVPAIAVRSLPAIWQSLHASDKDQSQDTSTGKRIRVKSYNSDDFAEVISTLMRGDRDKPIKEEVSSIIRTLGGVIPTKADYYKGVYYGLMYGDAFGAPFEFYSNRGRPVTPELILPITMTSRWVGKRVGAIGQITDDTEMTIALLESVLSNNDYIVDDVVRSYMDWANSTKMLGVNTRKLFKGIKTIKGFWNRWKRTDFTNLQSNGCLMRCTGLLPLADRPDFKGIVTRDVSLTNDNDVCIDSVWVYLQIMIYLRHNKDLNSVRRKADRIITNKSVRKVFDDAVAGKKRDVSGRDKGWVLHALYVAVYVLFHFHSFTDAMIYVVKLHGDTDTNAAIAGALLGSLIGYNNMNREKYFRINIDKIINSETMDGDFPRPTNYTAKHLIGLVNAQIRRS